MCNELYARNPKTLRYGTETISSLSDSNGIRIHNHLVHERTLNHLDRLFPRICALIPQNIKDSSSLKGVLENGNPAAHNVYAKKIWQISHFIELNSSPPFSVSVSVF